MVRQGDETAIYYNNKTEEPEKAYGRGQWTESYVQWSPHGTYLATFHRQGIALWGGPSWKKLVRFPQNAVRFIDFSPRETYVVTWSPEGDKAEDGEVHNLYVWDVRSGKMLRSFVAPPPAATGKMNWPVLKWSHDERFFARLGTDAISVYETPSMGLMDKRSLRIEGVQDFAWSPTDNVMAFSQPEAGNVPARVTLMEIPSKAIRRTRNLFNVQDYRLHWHPDGDYFAVKVDRRHGKKQSTSFELFRVRDKEVPVEVLELKDHVIAFAWEPKGDKFVMAHGDPPAQGAAAQPASVSFYSMEASKGKDATVKLIRTCLALPHEKACVLLARC
jgi:translation initiation factor 3 subunit B